VVVILFSTISLIINWIGYFKIFGLKVQLKPLVALVLMTMIIIIFVIVFSPVLKHKKPPINADISQQIEKLDEIQSSLTRLESFISNQKEKLQEAEKTLTSLKEEKQKLEPVVKADRQLVESILQSEQVRSRREVWKDRMFGFIMGFFSSLSASSVISLVKRRK
jgi:septal ring factor EnvC (AmiA/AmiB activator)